ncbi:D-amino-acid oxidase [Portunus trituberculatus]|uniref:D-amino-acid oxidase n=1 Tax=Portunus trituberculatus TaxID=210409 RepID=A0A5B7CLU5_PORTR|nr:D-amino-acid oxidase [Portunus trituberculatus]
MLEEVKARGGHLEELSISSLEEAASEADLLINCSGLGARDLVPDPSVFPCRGQVMRECYRGEYYYKRLDCAGN